MRGCDDLEIGVLGLIERALEHRDEITLRTWTKRAIQIIEEEDARAWRGSQCGDEAESDQGPFAQVVGGYPAGICDLHLDTIRPSTALRVRIAV
jgi:hypothetical protein